MKKLAIFVEGHTETIFVKRLLEEIAGHKNIIFNEKLARNLTELAGISTITHKKYFVLIINCEQDEAVKSKIIMNCNSLISADYNLILGLRDVYPIKKTDIEKLENGLKIGLDKFAIKIEICLAVMELEAWFLQEDKHYVKIDPRLDLETIFNRTGFHPKRDNSEEITHPAALLKSIYQIIGKSYNKTKHHVDRTVDALDYENIYFALPSKLSYLEKFLFHINEFMSYA